MIERRFPLVLVLAGLLAACDSNPAKPGAGGIAFAGSPTAPTASTGSFTGASLTPLPLPLTRVPFVGFGCPSAQPFSTSFSIHVGANHGDLFFNGLSFHFVDGSNVSGSPVLMSSADMSARFGSTLIPAGTARDFPLAPQFGCGLSLPVDLVLTASFADRGGTPQDTTMTVPVQ